MNLPHRSPVLADLIRHHLRDEKERDPVRARSPAHRVHAPRMSILISFQCRVPLAARCILVLQTFGCARLPPQVSLSSPPGSPVPRYGGYRSSKASRPSRSTGRGCRFMVTSVATHQSPACAAQFNVRVCGLKTCCAMSDSEKERYLTVALSITRTPAGNKADPVFPGKKGHYVAPPLLISSQTASTCSGAKRSRTSRVRPRSVRSGRLTSPASSSRFNRAR